MRLSEVGKQAVATIGAEESLESAAKLMRDLHVGDLIVVEFKDGRKTPVGILTDRDIVMATVALGAHPEVLNVGEIMTRKLVIAREVDSLARVIELMKDNGVKRIPIVAESGELSGVICLEDIISQMAEDFSSLSQISGKEKEKEFDRRRKFD